MYSATRRETRRHRLGLVLAGVLVSATGVAITQPGIWVPVHVPGATAAPRSERSGAGGESTDPSAAVGEGRATAPGKPIRGDKSLRGPLELADAKLEEGRYVVHLGKRKHAVLTIDPEVQKAAEDALSRAKVSQGAIVVMGVDGRILALAGHRHGSEGSPRLGRHLDLATSIWAPAASVFKIVTSAALVKAGVRPSSKVCYHGGFRSVESSNLSDDKARDTQCGDLTVGVAKSQNAIMAKLAHRHLRAGTLRAMARAFGFGVSPEFALPAEIGRVDIPASGLDFARVAAGFWHTELSPLGGALVANTVASGGLSVTPYIVDMVVEGQRITPVKPEKSQRVLPESVARDVARMMEATVEGGTATKGFQDLKKRPFLPQTSVAGKTGTLMRNSPYLEYSWFVGFAPSDAPQVSISVLLGNPPRWHLKAHTAARMVLQALF
ncbi:penicillin-binding transpeptidase domain-containing protein [Haliangium ochraceum]|uniref:Penicillin-binding protein transpeptidase n=1 Tax=Haliangium ochraceum (strain DSM 14365 / JCM 11303 / SMP-2) TaxID=502025 RepID=D0LJ59_HALO1|nr:penicillin-binding transpeptidase domain-containing protein [Haliangium ochraceum]ACY14906.1 penicillin-binding protein transpeptidase [Haliangium ochraceum DSM 14365]